MEPTDIFTDGAVSKKDGSFEDLQKLLIDSKTQISALFSSESLIPALETAYAPLLA